MKNIFAKKGVSPIVASVLLVVITIAIGATTMAFLRSLTDSNLEKTKEQTGKISCGTDVSLQIPVVQNINKICYFNADGTLRVTLHNVGTKTIKGFNLITVKTDGTAITNSTNTSLNFVRDGWTMLNISTGIANASVNILQFRLEPKIDGTSGDMICSDSGIVKDLAELATC